MLHDFSIENGEVKFSIALPDPNYAYKQVLERECRLTLMEQVGVKSVHIQWLTNRPSGEGYSAPISEPIIIAVASGKGGVGKSTVSVNLACALAQNGVQVGLLDADIYGPNCNIMMGAERANPSATKKFAPAIAHGVKVVSMGFLVRPEQPLVWRGPMLHSALREFLNDVEWGQLDFLVVDLPPGTGDAQLSLAQQTKITAGVIVTLPQKVSQADARRGLEMFNQLNIPVLGVIENMSGSVFGQGGGEELASAAEVAFLGRIPLDPQVRVQGDSGLPVVISHPTSESAIALQSIAKSVADSAIYLHNANNDELEIEVLE